MPLLVTVLSRTATKCVKFIVFQEGVEIRRRPEKVTDTETDCQTKKQNEKKTKETGGQKQTHFLDIIVFHYVAVGLFIMQI